MSLNYENVIGRNIRQNTNGAVITNANEKPDPANYWFNVGYQMEVENDEGVVEMRFIALAQGIPLDTLATLSTKGSSRMYREMQAAKNDLRDQCIETAKQLEPGEERLFDIGDTGLQLQMRRVKEVQAEVKTSENRFSKRLHFAG